MLSLDPLGLDSAMLDEARAYMRVERAEDDPSLAAALLAALGHAERFTRTILIRRNAVEMLSACSGWQILQAVPVHNITAVTGIPAEGARFALSHDAWEAKLGSQGDTYIRIINAGIAGRVEITCQAGLVPDWRSLPEILRLGVLRHAAHFFAHRDVATDAGPPAAARVLLLPWRRMRLS